MIVSKCCHACGMAFEKSQLTNGLCPWCSSYQADKHIAMFVAATWAVGIVVVIGVATWMLTP